MVMLLTGKKQWVHKYRKEHPEERDMDEKFLLIEILRNEFGLHGLTGEVVVVGEKFVYPDVFVKSTEPQQAFELDGYYHGDGENLRERDRVRDDLYKIARVNVFHINRRATDNYRRELIIECLRSKGLAKATF